MECVCIFAPQTNTTHTMNTQREIEAMMQTLEQGGVFSNNDGQREYVRKRLQNIANAAVNDFHEAIKAAAKAIKTA
jgi:hypothetical protein